MEETINRLAYELGLTPKEVKSVYKGFWQFIRTKIGELPLSSINSLNELDGIKTSFNLPYLGKLVFSPSKWLKIKEAKNGNKYKED